MTAGANAAVAAGAAIARAIKASGVLVSVEPPEFRKILERQNEPLVVVSERGGFFGKTVRYLTSYKGLAFYMKTSDSFSLPGRCEVVRCRKIWIPG